MSMDIDRCPQCGSPAHASESNEDGVCIDCLRGTADLDIDLANAAEVQTALLCVLSLKRVPPIAEIESWSLAQRDAAVTWMHAYWRASLMSGGVYPPPPDHVAKFSLDTFDRYAPAIAELDWNAGDRRERMEMDALYLESMSYPPTGGR